VSTAVQEGCYRVSWALLGEWWCAPADMSEDDCIKAIAAATTAPVSDPELIRDRLYGGFGCATDAARRHFHFATGQYTYLGENFPLSDDERRDHWKQLILINGEPGNGPFTHAGPKP